LWILGWTHHKHSHPANPDPFSYDQHKAKKPGFASSIQQAIIHCGAVSYTSSLKMLRKEGLPGLSALDFYNLNRKNEKETERLTKQEEISLILHYLEMQDFHVQVRYEHLLDNDGE
jgi:hypothetical protein